MLCVCVWTQQPQQQQHQSGRWKVNVLLLEKKGAGTPSWCLMMEVGGVGWGVSTMSHRDDRLVGNKGKNASLSVDFVNED